MKNCIWKFPLKIEQEQTIQMPTTSKILDVQFQNGELVMWAVVFPDNAKIGTKIFIHPTGHPVPDMHQKEYIGTVQTPIGEWGITVWHVFIGHA